MHLAFVDIAYGYKANRPEEDQPLGGTTSALCFLARALKQSGIDCTIFNKITEPQTACSIQSLPLETLTDERRNPGYDAFIFCGRWTDWLVAHIAEAAHAPLIAWMHESLFTPPLVPALPQFNGVVFVSDWQAGINKGFLRDGQKQITIRNAMGPWYENMFPPEMPVAPSKHPIAVYIGATPRGLLHLPKIWPRLKSDFPDLTLQIFANPAPTQDAVQNAALTESLRAMPGVTHVGQVGQTQLAAALQKAAFYLAPNPYPETSCIAMIEAMAAGLCCITTARAALPETAHGFALQVPIKAANDPQLFTQSLDHDLFYATAATAIHARLNDSAAWEHKLREQIDYFRRHYLWQDRVTPWTTFIQGCLSR